MKSLVFSFLLLFPFIYFIFLILICNFASRTEIDQLVNFSIAFSRCSQEFRIFIVTDRRVHCGSGVARFCDVTSCLIKAAYSFYRTSLNFYCSNSKTMSYLLKLMRYTIQCSFNNSNWQGV